MSEQESRRTERDVQHEVAKHTDRLGKHEAGLGRYLGSIFYADQQDYREALAAQPAAAQAPAPKPVGPVRPYVVVGVDEAPSSFVAAEHAATEAALRGWALRVIHVQQRAHGVQFTQARDRGAALLTELAHRIRGRAPDALVTTELCVGSTADMLLERSVDAGMLVVGSRGLGALTTVMAGSISTQLAAHASVPVLVVRMPPTPAGPDRPPSVVVGVDGSASSNAAAAFAAEEARLRGVALTALHAIADTESTVAGGRVDPLTSGALDPVHGSVTGLVVHRRQVEGSADEILIESSAHAVVTVVGARGGGGIRGVRLGSTSQAVIRHAHSPVFVIHPPVRAQSPATAA